MDLYILKMQRIMLFRQSILKTLKQSTLQAKNSFLYLRTASSSLIFALHQMVNFGDQEIERQSNSSSIQVFIQVGLETFQLLSRVVIHPETTCMECILSYSHDCQIGDGWLFFSTMPMLRIGCLTTMTSKERICYLSILNSLLLEVLLICM